MSGFATSLPGVCRATAWTVTLLIAAGCTICPDPFDYSGPVPNGSAPQNDFRARANGLAPLGGHPRPWPPVVQDASGSADDRSPTALAAAEEPAAESVDANAADEPAAVQAAAEMVEPTATETEPAALPDPAEPPTAPLLPPVAPRLEVVPPLQETPGWRPRG